MPQPLRKIFQKNLLSGADAAAPQGRRERAGRSEAGGGGRKAASGPRRRTLDLSGAATTALGLALVAAVGWAFFMGYLVGRGEHPGRGVESMAGLILPQGTGGTAGGRAPLPGEEALLPAQRGAPAPDLADAGDLSGASGAPAAAQASQGPAPEPAPEPGGAPEAAPEARAPAYPFNRPRGEGLAGAGAASGRRPAKGPCGHGFRARGAARAARSGRAAQARRAPF